MCNKFEENRTAVFASRFNKLLEQRGGVSMEKLAEELQTTKPTLYRWKNGEVYPQAVNLAAICEYFHVPKNYFETVQDERILTDEKYHQEVSESRLVFAQNSGLNVHFIEFLKDSPALADAIISASYVEASENTFSPNVPETDSPFQFVSSSGVKIYLPFDMLYLLSGLQDELTEYAQFLIERRIKKDEARSIANRKRIPKAVQDLINTFPEGKQREAFSSIAAAAVVVQRMNKEKSYGAVLEEIVENLRNELVKNKLPLNAARAKICVNSADGSVKILLSPVKAKKGFSFAVEVENG